ncbi:hypothetical protein IHE44_0005744, partial [Lamprotornis superbus]
MTALMSPGNIGQLSILGCAFEPDIQMDSIVVQWAKEGVAGLVHKLRGRMAMFADQVMGRNASLELRDVQLSDAGTYQCSVTTEGVGKQFCSTGQ